MGAPARTRPNRHPAWSLPNWAIETSNHAVVGVDRQGKIVSWNPGARRLFGYSSTEILGKSLSRLLCPQDRAGASKFLTSFRRGRDVEYQETVCLRKGGRRVDVAFTAIPQVGSDASVGCLILRDISQRKTLETRIAGAVTMLEDAHQVAGITSWQWDIGKDEVTWSGEFNRMLGLDRSIVRANFKKLLARVSPEDRGRFQKAVDRAIHQGEPYECRHGLTRSDGSRLEVFSQGRLIVGPTPGERRLVGISQDASRLSGPETARRALRTQSRLASDQARGAFFSVEAGAILFDSFDYPSTLVRLTEEIVPRLADRCAVDLLGADGSVLHLPVAGGVERQSPLDKLGEEAVLRVLKTGEYELQRRGSKRKGDRSSMLVLPLRTRRGIVGAMTLVQAESGRIFRSIDLRTFQVLARLTGLAIENGQLYRDAADLNRELEAKVNRRTAELQEALRDLDDYASSVAHDLKAPLRAIRAFTEALREDFGDRLNEQARQYVGRICGACARLDVFISDLLTYSRVCRREVELVPVSVAKLTEEVARQMEEELSERGGRLQIERTAEKVKANSTLLAQVLTNLISNAAKFVAPDVRPEIRVSVERRGDRVRLWVKDNGIGIAPEHLEAIFRPFERLHPIEIYAGTGLGLAIVWKGMDRMGGLAGAESEVGKGSRFWVELPSA